MTKTLISNLIFLFFFSNSWALDEQIIAKRADAFLKLACEQHLQAPDIHSEKFHFQVLNYLLDQLDYEKTIFTSEDEIHLKNNIHLLASDIKDQKIEFLKLIHSLYKQRMLALSKFNATFYNTPFLSTSKISLKPSDFDVRSSQNSQLNKWQNAYRYDVLSTALMMADSSQLNLDSLEILVQAQFEQNKEEQLSYTEDESEIDLYFEDAYLNALAMSFDPHTSYFNIVQEKEFMDELSGNRELFGFSLDKNKAGQFFVSNLVPGSPAWISGEIETNDVILELKFDKNKAINLQSLSLSELENIFAKSNADKIVLTVEEEDKSLREVELEKKLVQLDGELVKSAILKGTKKVGYINLPDFYTSWSIDDQGLGCANDVAKAIIKLKKDNIEGLIVDLRGNGGGSLKEAVDLVGIFIDYGPVLITRNNNNELEIIKDFNRGSIYTAPLIILIDENSASASEIVAAALQDHKRSLIVGHTSFGKSTGQGILPIPNTNIEEDDGQGYAKITMDGIYRIDLSTHQGNGVVPDVHLPELFVEDVFRESSIPNSLVLDSIDKKVYYVPLVLPNAGHLQAQSNERIENDLSYVEIKKLFEQLQFHYSENRTITLSLPELLNEQLVINDIIRQIKKWKENLKVDFEAQNPNFDNEIYKDGSLTKQYNDFFLGRLSKDRELNETYKVMVDYINETTNN